MCLRAKLHQECCFENFRFERALTTDRFSRKAEPVIHPVAAAAQAQVGVETFQVNMLRR